MNCSLTCFIKKNYLGFYPVHLYVGELSTFVVQVHPKILFSWMMLRYYISASLNWQSLLFVVYCGVKGKRWDKYFLLKNSNQFFYADQKKHSTNISFIFWCLICQCPVGWHLATPILPMNATRLLNWTNQRLSSSYFGVSIGKVVQ